MLYPWRIPHTVREWVLSRFSRVWLSATLWTVARQAPLSMGFSSKNTGVGCHALLQGIFPSQGSNPHLLVSPIGRWVLYHQHHPGSPLTQYILFHIGSKTHPWLTLCQPSECVTCSEHSIMSICWRNKWMNEQILSPLPSWKSFRQKWNIQHSQRVSLVAQTVENLPVMPTFQPWVWEIAWVKGMATHSSTLAWRIHGQRSLAGYSSWGAKSQTRLSI